MKALKLGYAVAEIPSHEFERRWGSSKISVWKLWAAYLWSFFTNILQCPESEIPLTNFPERGARLARRDDREYREYLREEQRRQPGCPARKMSTNL